MPSSKHISAAYQLARQRYADLGVDTEAAIRSDPGLTDDEREALIAVYRSYRQRRPEA